MQIETRRITRKYYLGRRRVESIRGAFNADKEPTYGLHRKKQMPFFRMLKKEIFGDTQLDEDGISSLVSLTQQVFADMAMLIELGASFLSFVR